MGASLDLGMLYGKIAVDYSDFTKAEIEARKFSQDVKGHFKSIENAGRNMASVGKGLTAAVTVPLVGIGAAAFQAARDFATAFSDVEKNISDLDESNIKQFRNEILQLGKDSMLGASGIAALVSEGGKLGESSKGAMEFAKAAEMIAVAFDFGTTIQAAEQAGEIIGGLRSSFGYTTAEVLELSDSINYFADTTAAGAASVTRILQAQGATVANVTNLSKSQLAALAASFDSVAPSTEIAATGMKNFILSLASGTAATKRQAGVFKQLGFSAEGMAKMLTKDADGAILKVLNSLKKLSKEDQAAATMILFGKESIGAISPLIGNLSLLEDAFAKANDSAKSLGSVKKEYDRLNESDNAKITKALNALNVVMIEIGAQILPIVGELATKFSEWLKSLGPLEPEMVKVGLAFGAVAAAVGPVLLAIGSAVAVIAPFIASAGGLGAALLSLAGMAGPVGIAIAAIVAGGVYLYKNWDKVKETATAMVPVIMAAWEELKSFGVAAWGAITQAVSDVIDWFQRWAERNSGLIEEIKAVWEELVAAGSQLWNAISEDIGKSITAIVEWIEKAIEPMGGWQGVWEIFKAAVSDTLTQLGIALKGFLEGVKFAFEAITNLLNGETWKYWEEQVQQAIKSVTDWLDEMVESANQTVEDITNAFTSVDWVQVGRDVMGGIAKGITEFAGAPVKAGQDAGKKIIESVKGIFDSHSPSRVFADIGKDLMSGLSLGVNTNTQSAVSAVIMAADNMISTAKEKLSAEEIRKQLTQGLTNQVMDLNKSITLGEDGSGMGATNYELELAKEQAYYDKSLALLQKAEEMKITSIRPYHELREQMEQQHVSNMLEIYKGLVSSTKQSLDATLGSLKEFGAEQSGIYKGIFAVSKAFAIAEAMIALQQNIANASKVGFPYNIPFIAGAVAQGASIVASVQSIAGAFNNGGYLGAGQVGLVAETGRPEFVNGVLVGGPANITSSQKTGEILRNGGGSGVTNVYVDVINNIGAQVSVSQSGDDREKFLRVVIDQAKQEIAADAIRGDGPVDRAFAQTFEMQRKMA